MDKSNLTKWQQMALRAIFPNYENTTVDKMLNALISAYVDDEVPNNSRILGEQHRQPCTTHIKEVVSVARRQLPDSRDPNTSPIVEIFTVLPADYDPNRKVNFSPMPFVGDTPKMVSVLFRKTGYGPQNSNHITWEVTT